MSDNEQKERIGISIDSVTLTKVDAQLKKSGVKSRSEYINIAVDAYLDFLNNETIRNVVAPMFETVVSAKIEDDERAATLEKAKALVERFGGKITNVDDWGKKRLAYEVQKMKDAFYYFIQFEAESNVPAEIESRIRIMDNVIRYLCVRQDEK